MARPVHAYARGPREQGPDAVHLAGVPGPERPPPASLGLVQHSTAGAARALQRLISLPEAPSLPPIEGGQ